MSTEHQEQVLKNLEQAKNSWQEKKSFFELELVKTDSPGKKFELQKEIDRCRQEIKRLSEEIKSLNKDLGATNKTNNQQILLKIAKEIQESTQQCLRENEKALFPLFQNPAKNRWEVGNKLLELLENQIHRGDFGRWKSSLETIYCQEPDLEVRKKIQQLLDAVNKLYESFYFRQFNIYTKNEGEKGKFETNKHYIELVIGNRGNDPRYYQLPDAELFSIARNYLDNLRNQVEEIGNAVGTLTILKVLPQNPPKTNLDISSNKGVEMQSITWLHLSDWHQQGKDFNRTVVRDALIEDIKQRKKISTDLATIDFIVFSGDVAFFGKKEEYEMAIQELFDPVLEATGLTKDKLFIIPGNHDLDRKHIFELLPPQLHNPFNSKDEVIEWLTDDKRRNRLLEPFSDYKDFIAKYTGQDSPDYASLKKLNVNGKEIALLGINSALMCARNKIKINDKEEVNDYGHLIVGEPQIYHALKQIAQADIRITVLHHPFNWLNNFIDSQIAEDLGKVCHFILQGHQHLPQISINQGTGGDCVIIPAGASYDRRDSNSQKYVNSYNFVHLNWETQKWTFFPRRWSERRKEWIKDIELPNIPPDGQFPLPKLGNPEPPPIISEWEERTKSSDKQNSTKFNQARNYSSRSLIKLVNHIGDSWRDVANYFEISDVKRRGFQAGREIEDIWRCLEQIRRLDEIEEAFKAIDRTDLIQYLIQNP